MIHERYSHETEPIADVIYMTDIAKDSIKRVLNSEQKEYFHSQAAYYDQVAEFAKKQLDYALTQRAYALEMLEMIPDNGGYPE